MIYPKEKWVPVFNTTLEELENNNISAEKLGFKDYCYLKKDDREKIKPIICKLFNLPVEDVEDFHIDDYGVKYGHNNTQVWITLNKNVKEKYEILRRLGRNLDKEDMKLIYE